MNEFIISAFFISISVISVVTSILFMRSTEKGKQRNNDISVNTQQAVKQNIALYAVNNRGASMDISEIFTIDPATIGF